MKNQPVLAVIVASSAQFCDSLRVLLMAVPCIDRVLVLNQKTEMPDFGQRAQPLFVLLDFSLAESWMLSLLTHIKQQADLSRAIVLVNNEQERAVAAAAGADLVFVKGVSAAKLFATIENTLNGAVAGICSSRPICASKDL